MTSLLAGAGPRWSDRGDPLQTLPKVSLHDHLDGSLRPETMLELADAQGERLPYADPQTLAGWFQGTVAEPVVENWDEKFGVTTRLMRDHESIARVCREFVLDLAADGVVYGEVRWAPEKHTGLGPAGLTLDEAVDAVTAGLADGERAAAAAGSSIAVRQILCGMRTSRLSTQIADLTIRHCGDSVVGFDLAGEELGYPPSDHLEAFQRVHDAGVPITIHAGEHDGVGSLAQAVEACHASRIGHGVRVVEDIRVSGQPLEIGTARARLAAAGADADICFGPVAARMRDRAVPLEVCLSSNSDGHVVAGRANHPLGELKRLGFAVTVNPDNRMMSATCVTREMRYAVELYGWTADDLLDVTRRAVSAAFLPARERDRLLEQVVAPGFAQWQRDHPTIPALRTAADLTEPRG